MSKRSIKLRKQSILIIILSLVIGSFIGYRFALAQTGNSLKSVVEPGSMTSEYSYIIFTDGSTVYARNGTTGEIEFSGTNASQVIQNAINKLSGWATYNIYLKGSITIANTININASNCPYLNLFFDYLTLISDVNGITVDNGGSGYSNWFGKIEGTSFNFPNGYTHAVILLRNVAYGNVNVNVITGSGGAGSAGIELLGDTANIGSMFNKVTFDRIYNVGTGILLNASATNSFVSSNIISGGMIQYAVTSEVRLTGGDVTSNRFFNIVADGYGSGYSGVGIYGYLIDATEAHDDLFYGCEIDDTVGSTVDIYVASGCYVTFYGGIFYHTGGPWPNGVANVINYGHLVMDNAYGYPNYPTIQNGYVYGNFLTNGDFEQWTNGVPNGWNFAEGGTIAQETTIVKVHLSSVKITAPDNVEAALDQPLSNPASYAGKTLYFGAWINATVGYRARVRILDYANGSYDEGGISTHIGDGQWHWVETYYTIRPNATIVWARLSIDPGNATTAYFDGAVLSESPILQSFSPYVNSGITTVSNNAWVAHGLASTPSTVTVTSMNATYSNQPVIVSWTNSNSTHFQVGVYWANGTAITNNVISISWHAEV